MKRGPDFDLMAVSRGARTEAGDTGFTDEHRLHRFALHLPVWAELDRRLMERQKTREKHPGDADALGTDGSQGRDTGEEQHPALAKKVMRTGGL